MSAQMKEEERRQRKKRERSRLPPESDPEPRQGSLTQT